MSGRRYNRSTTDCYKNHLQLRGRRWFYRRSIPPDLRARLGRREIVRALRTESLTEAEGLAAALDQRVSYVFHMTRRDAQVGAEALIERLCDTPYPLAFSRCHTVWCVTTGGYGVRSTY